MGGPPPPIVGGGVDAKSIKPVEDVVAQSSVVANAKKTPTSPLSASKEIVLRKPSKVKSPETWEPQDFHKDAEFFRLVCGLPSEGLAPHKISDISDDLLLRVFGESSKNGYKLSNVQGIPQSHILALSQVVDGYDKPVNGILSHTFAKGVYADMIQSRKVNWAAYAATKLKGQVTQWARDGKAKPKGPPCVRKQQWYVPPTAPVNTAAPIPVECEPDQKSLESAMQKDRNLSAPVTVLELPAISLPVQVNTSAWNSEKPRQNVLISIMDSEMCKMKARLVEVKEKARMVQNSIVKLENYQQDYRSVEAACQDEILRLKREERKIVAEILAEDASIEDLTTDIELESNKLCEGDGDGGGDGTEEVTEELLRYMTESLKNHTTTAKCLAELLESTRWKLSAALDDLSRKAKKHPDTPETFSRLSKVSATLEAEQAKIESSLKAQQDELKIISEVFSAPCPPVIIPCYTLTSTDAVYCEVDVSTCPICCNGYHCFNWIPASCGHTFHPACLFASISGCKGGPKCFACGEAFSGDWLQSWGIERGQGSEVGVEKSLPRHEDLKLELENVYGTQCGSLAQRRLSVKTLDKDFHSKAKHCVDTVMLSSTVITCSTEEGGESLLVPKLEGESKGKRKAADRVEPTNRKVK